MREEERVRNLDVPWDCRETGRGWNRDSEGRSVAVEEERAANIWHRGLRRLPCAG